MGTRIVSTAATGMLEVEYVLFDPGDVLVTGNPALGVHERGYLTTAQLARERLTAAGASVQLARSAFEALGRQRASALARTESVGALADHLAAYEAFEGGAFSPESEDYEGVWLDLRVLAARCMDAGLDRAALLVQALHLALVLDEVADDVPVQLYTAKVAPTLKAGQRTWRRVGLEGIATVPDVFRRLPGNPSANRDDDESVVREDLLRRLRDRCATSYESQPRLQGLAAALLAMPEGAAQKRAMPSTPPVEGELTTEAIPAARLFNDLRAHSNLLRGEGHLEDVAKFLSGMANRDLSVPELAVLASRAWLAAGEQAHARYFARRVVDDPTMARDARHAASEILEATSVTQESLVPPPTSDGEIIPSIVHVIEDPRPAPPGASMPPFAPVVPSAVRRVTAPSDHRFVTSAPAPAIISAQKADARVEIIESLSDPPREADDSRVVNPRVEFTRLARELGRDYRLWYGTVLRTGPLAIDAMQRHLRRRFSESIQDAAKLQHELLRHGALFAEVLARTLGARWLDVEDAEKGRWAMLVPPSTRVWPIGRVYRFYQQGHREADLLTTYFELARAQAAQQ